MIHSRASDGTEVARGITIGLRRFTGAVSARVIEGGNRRVEEHFHDWPIISLYIMGDYKKQFQDGEAAIAGPSAVLHGAGEPHANLMGAAGLEQVDIEFDPAWLGLSRPCLAGVRCWRGGRVASEAGRLAALWSSPGISERLLATATARFLGTALADGDERRPLWLDTVLERIAIDPATSATDLARRADLHPSWLAQAYRAAMGEGLRQTLQRRRVEQATILLRETDCGAADVAVAAGFCDQSHMIRGFKKLLGRTPSQVRAERSALMPGMPRKPPKSPAISAYSLPQ